MAAIELEMGQPLDYDRELKTVGWSNLISGSFGGYTGSYIFSQTIFTMRSGIRDRTTGFTVAIAELFIIVLPFPVISYIPKMFFGSLLMMICCDLMYEWLVGARDKLDGPFDVGVAWFTFAVTMVSGVQWGIVLGAIVFVAGKKYFLNKGGVDNNKRKGGGREEEEDSFKTHLII